MVATTGIFSGVGEISVSPEIAFLAVLIVLGPTFALAVVWWRRGRFRIPASAPRTVPGPATSRESVRAALDWLAGAPVHRVVTLQATPGVLGAMLTGQAYAVELVVADGRRELERRDVLADLRDVRRRALLAVELEYRLRDAGERLGIATFEEG